MKREYFQKNIKKYIKLMYYHSVDACNRKYKKIRLIKKTSKVTY